MLGHEVLALTDEDLSGFRGRTVSMISKGYPVHTIGRQIAETVPRHEGKSYAQRRARALHMLEVVRIPWGAAALFPSA